LRFVTYYLPDLDCYQSFLTHREISAQEAAYRLLGLPLTKTSRQGLFIPTKLKQLGVEYMGKYLVGI
jgi:hypothetical protein